MANPPQTTTGGEALYPVKLSGGPCNGRTLELPQSQLQTNMVVCGGRVYVYAGDSTNPPIFQMAADKAQYKPPGVSYTTSDVFTAFHSLMYTLGHRIPAGVTRIRGDLRRIRKAVG